LAIIWELDSNSTNYQVRTAGNSIRLYSNGVFHSQFNPQRPFCGQLWDLLSLPCLFPDPREIHNVLILGVGGGAVIKQLQILLDRPHITGIDIDPTHLHIAQHFFDVNSTVNLVCADAVSWVSEHKGKKFDLIVDDLFFEKDGEPHRAVQADDFWMSLLMQHLSSNGLLVSNFVSRQEFRDCAILQNDALWQQFPSIFQLSTTLTENRIGIFLKKRGDNNHWRRQLLSHPEINTKELRYTLRKVK